MGRQGWRRLREERLDFSGSQAGIGGPPRRGNLPKSEGPGAFRPLLLQVRTLSTGSLTAVVRAEPTGRRRRASLCDCSEDACTGHFRDIGPPVNVLAGANPNGRAGFRHAIPGNVKLGDVAPAVSRRWQQPQEREVLHAADTGPDRGGALHQRVLGRRAGDAELERNLATGVGNDQLGHRVGTEDGLGGREVELGQVKVGAPCVQTRKEVVAVQAHPAARFGYKGIISRGKAPRGALLGAKSAPAPEDSAEVAAVALLLGGAGIARAHVLAHDLAVTAVDINDGALPARLWNGADFHVVSGTRLLRCRFTRPQLGECSNHSQTGAREASSINCSR